MKFFIRTMTILATVGTLFVSLVAEATNYSLWINGRTGGGQVGNYNDFTYWGPASTAAGINKKAVNWDGVNSISSQSGVIRNALDCYCTGTNWCYVAIHSAGGLMIGYNLALFGGSTRFKKTPSPAANGTCSNSDGTTQVGWNIYWVDNASSAAGGSELANVGQVFTGNAIDIDLKTGNARALYDHNQTRSKTFYMFAGASGTLYSGILPGQDDEAVSYHSSGGVSATGNFCNPGDLFCSGTLTLGTAATSNGKAKWTNHSVQFRDDGESYNHYTKGNWGGIVSQVRIDMVNYAK